MLNLLCHVSGTPRASAEVYDEASMYGKQIKRESPPIRSFEGGITKGKPYEAVNTIKEMGRSIHEIPRKETQDNRKTPVLEGSITQVLDLRLLVFPTLTTLVLVLKNIHKSNSDQSNERCLQTTVYCCPNFLNVHLCRVFL